MVNILILFHTHTNKHMKNFTNDFCLVWSKIIIIFKCLFLFDFVFVNIENSIKPTPTGCCYINKIQILKQIYETHENFAHILLLAGKNGNIFFRIIERVCSLANSNKKIHIKYIYTECLEIHNGLLQFWWFCYLFFIFYLQIFALNIHENKVNSN